MENPFPEERPLETRIEDAFPQKSYFPESDKAFEEGRLIASGILLVYEVARLGVTSLNRHVTNYRIRDQ